MLCVSCYDYWFPVMIIAIITTITIITCSTGQTKTSQQSLSSPTWHDQGFLGTFYIPNCKKKKKKENHSPTHLSLSSETGGIWIHVKRSSTQNFFICRLQTTDSNNKKWQIATTTTTNSNCWPFFPSNQLEWHWSLLDCQRTSIVRSAYLGLNSSPVKHVV